MGTIRKSLGIACLVILASSPTRAGERVVRSLDLGPTPKVGVENVAGSVEVQGWDGPTVEIAATLGDGVEGLDIDARSGAVDIEVKLPKRDRSWDSRRNIEVELVIKVPRGTELSVETVSAEIDVTGVDGSVSLESVSGSMDATGKPRHAELETVSGSISFRGDESAVDAESVSGSITLEGVAHSVSVSTVSGSQRVEAGEIERASFESVSGHIRFRGRLTAGARLDVDSHSGGVDLYLPADTSAEVEVDTFSGGIDNDFGADGERQGRHGPGRRLRTTLGSGSARIRVDSFSGSVSLHRQ